MTLLDIFQERYKVNSIRSVHSLDQSILDLLNKNLGDRPKLNREYLSDKYFINNGPIETAGDDYLY